MKDQYTKKLENLLADIYRNVIGGDNIDLSDEQMQFWEDVVNNAKIQHRMLLMKKMDAKAVKQKVLEYTEKHKIFDIEELHQNIGCKLSLLVDVIDQLKKEGRIVEENSPNLMRWLKK